MTRNAWLEILDRYRECFLSSPGVRLYAVFKG